MHDTKVDRNGEDPVFVSLVSSRSMGCWPAASGDSTNPAQLANIIRCFGGPTIAMPVLCENCVSGDSSIAVEFRFDRSTDVVADIAVLMSLGQCEG